MNDRTQLAEAMGWTRCGLYYGSPPKGKFKFALLPDPENDANDDYAVLEWMRNGNQDTFSDFKDALYHEERGHGTHNVWNYKLGKFARAALKVIENE